MDEIANVRLHQWLSGCRQLMATFPQHGVDELDARSPLGANRFRLGWNHSPPHFIFVPPDDSTDAQTTLTAPPEGTPVHEVPPGPSMLSSHFWHTLMPAFAEQAASELAGSEWTADRMATIARRIEQAHLKFGSGGPSEAFVEIAMGLRQAMANARGLGGDAPPDLVLFLEPGLDVCRAYMAFELPGQVAANLLAGVLAVQVNLPELGPPSEAPPEARAAAIEHLAALGSRLVMRRKRAQVTPYCELSYLANLYLMTASILMEHAEECGGLAEERIEELRGRAFVGEERRAREVAPVFHTGLWANAGKMVLDRAAETGRSVAAVCREHAVHPALRQVLLSPGSAVDPAPEAILERYREVAAGFEEEEVPAGLYGDYNPVAPANLERCSEGLQALAW